MYSPLSLVLNDELRRVPIGPVETTLAQTLESGTTCGFSRVTGNRSGASSAARAGSGASVPEVRSRERAPAAATARRATPAEKHQ